MYDTLYYVSRARTRVNNYNAGGVFYFGRDYIKMSGNLSSDQHILETIFNPEHPIVGKL